MTTVAGQIITAVLAAGCIPIMDFNLGAGLTGESAGADEAVVGRREFPGTGGIHDQGVLFPAEKRHEGG